MELIECLQAKKRLEDLINQKEDGIQFHSDALIAKWQTEIDIAKVNVAKFSITTDGEITKPEEGV